MGRLRKTYTICPPEEPSLRGSKYSPSRYTAREYNSMKLSIKIAIDSSIENEVLKIIG